MIMAIMQIIVVNWHVGHDDDSNFDHDDDRGGDLDDDHDYVGDVGHYDDNIILNTVTNLDDDHYTLLSTSIHHTLSSVITHRHSSSYITVSIVSLFLLS